MANVKKRLPSGKVQPSEAFSALESAIMDIQLPNTSSENWELKYCQELAVQSLNTIFSSVFLVDSTKYTGTFDQWVMDSALANFKRTTKGTDALPSLISNLNNQYKSFMKTYGDKRPEGWKAIFEMLPIIQRLAKMGKDGCLNS